LTPPKDNIRYFLTDDRSRTIGDVVWKNDEFFLVRGSQDQQPPEVTIRAPNGREIVDDRAFFWLGHEPALVVLTAPRSRTVRLAISTGLGPSVAPTESRVPMVTIEVGGKTLISFDTRSREILSVLVSLPVGASELVFRPTFEGAVVRNPNGDPRTLLAGIKILAVEWTD
jgi:hypothetical protein